jgi:hypothetical protein
LAVNLRISSLRKKSRKMNYPPSQTFNCGWDTLSNRVGGRLGVGEKNRSVALAASRVR